MDSRMSGPPGGANRFRLAEFPKEFERSFVETFDVRYYSFLLTSFVVLYGFVIFMTMQDWSLSEEQINALKERAIQKIYDVELVVNEEMAEEDPDEGVGTKVAEKEEKPEEVSEKGQERIEESESQRAERRKRDQAGREARSRQMQQEVGSQGILAVATSAGGAGAGNVAYSDVLQDLQGGAGGIGNIGDLVENTGGLSTAGGPGTGAGRAAKGSGQRRDGSGTGIDDLIAGSSVGGTSSFERRGDIKLASENVKVTGGAGKRDSESITAAINSQSASVDYCYQKSAKVNPNLKGRIDVEIEVLADGKVRNVRITKSTTGDRKLDRCVTRAIKRWRFGAVDNAGIAKIRVPFIF